ncbi:MAG TPA: hypothetical protein VM266_00865, partial [Solirubrobacteraceae bacterium]|nr:hypothetical protein [Solirubrobacteraceae bacterium]
PLPSPIRLRATPRPIANGPRPVRAPRLAPWPAWAGAALALAAVGAGGARSARARRRRSRLEPAPAARRGATVPH